MRKLLLSSVLLISFIILIISSQSSCKKETITNQVTVKDTVFVCNPRIAGLWEGTYTVGTGFPGPPGTSFYFSFHIYPGGKFSYKSKGYYNGSYDYVTFADGTWTLNGTSFAFSDITINAAGGTNFSQTGTATYNSVNSSLTNGVITNNGNTETFSLTRVN
ncbi:MAG: hypothetical protein IPL54_09940 [Chitinophagaceae bacterium]|nr:hypothetical protein [Chitinophagaceae bacterium]